MGLTAEVVNTTPRRTNVTAIQDRLVITVFDARLFLGESLDYETATIEVTAPIIADTNYVVYINGEQILLDSASLTISAFATAMAALIDALTEVTATASGAEYTIVTAAVGTTFSLRLDRLQDIKVETDDDILTLAYILVSKQLADAYTNNPFEDTDVDLITGALTVTDAVIPEAVRIGVLQLLRWALQDFNNEVIASGPVKRQKAGSLEIEYDATGKTAEELGMSQLPQLVKGILDMYRFVPGF